jgi:hypothetical protein
MCASDYLDTRSITEFQKRMGMLSDDGLIMELDRMRRVRKELDSAIAELESEMEIIQQIRSARYRMNNWFQEEINSTELTI